VVLALTQNIKSQMEKGFPIEVVQVVPFDEKGSMALGELAKTYEVDHLILAVLSSYEVEAFDRLPLQGSLQGGGPRASIPGYRAENYALAELALLDVSRGRVLVQADGEAWASLERLNVPLESNVYPVARRDQLVAPIYSEEAHAYDTLRGVAADDAIKQAVMHFKENWKQVFPA
jgi:hypothetical protein